MVPLLSPMNSEMPIMCPVFTNPSFEILPSCYKRASLFIHDNSQDHLVSFFFSETRIRLIMFNFGIFIPIHLGVLCLCRPSLTAIWCDTDTDIAIS